eukprot:765767-Hanusia_phi.AAC.15
MTPIQHHTPSPKIHPYPLRSPHPQGGLHVLPHLPQQASTTCSPPLPLPPSPPPLPSGRRPCLNLNELSSVLSYLLVLKRYVRSDVSPSHVLVSSCLLAVAGMCMCMCVSTGGWSLTALSLSVLLPTYSPPDTLLLGIRAFPSLQQQAVA